MNALAKFLAVMGIVGALSLPAQAHRGHDAISVVRITADHRVTVSHRFEVSDIEPALGDIAPGVQPSLDDPEAVKALSAYLASHFVLATEAGPVRLLPGAIDLGAAEARFSFAGRLPPKARRLTVRSDVLAGVYPGQMNQVNVILRGTTRTFAMSAGEVQTVNLPTLGSAAPRASRRP
jgi:hypothetical protein